MLKNIATIGLLALTLSACSSIGSVTLSGSYAVSPERGGVASTAVTYNTDTGRISSVSAGYSRVWVSPSGGVPSESINSTLNFK